MNCNTNANFSIPNKPSFSVVNKPILVYMFVFLADDTAQPSGRDRKHHTKDFDDLPTKAQNKHGQIFAME